MPDKIKQLLASAMSSKKDGDAERTIPSPPPASQMANGRPHLDPTGFFRILYDFLQINTLIFLVLVFMQQHTGWSDDQISEVHVDGF
jgi:hypothetical protein